jgi:hypothetical protein
LNKSTRPETRLAAALGTTGMSLIRVWKSSGDENLREKYFSKNCEGAGNTVSDQRLSGKVSRNPL